MPAGRFFHQLAWVKMQYLIVELGVADRGGEGLAAFAPGEGDQQDGFADHGVDRRAQDEFHGCIDVGRDGWGLGHLCLGGSRIVG